VGIELKALLKIRKLLISRAAKTAKLCELAKPLVHADLRLSRNAVDGGPPAESTFERTEIPGRLVRTRF
jgi:hypothetical protein